MACGGCGLMGLKAELAPCWSRCRAGMAQRPSRQGLHLGVTQALVAGHRDRPPRAAAAATDGGCHARLGIRLPRIASRDAPKRRANHAPINRMAGHAATRAGQCSTVFNGGRRRCVRSTSRQTNRQDGRDFQCSHFNLLHKNKQNPWDMHYADPKAGALRASGI